MAGMPQKTRSPRRGRLFVAEPLESRLVLTVLTVGTTADTRFSHSHVSPPRAVTEHALPTRTTHVSGTHGATSTSGAVMLAINAPLQGPRVVSVRRIGYHATVTTLVVTFNAPLEPNSAQNMFNYQITSPTGETLLVSSAVYSAKTNTVILKTVVPIDLHKPYTLTIIGTGAGGIKGTNGIFLNSTTRGRPGTNFVTRLDATNLVVSGSPTPGAASALKLAARARAVDAHRTLAKRL